LQNKNTATVLDVLNEVDNQLIELSTKQSTSAADADEASEEEGE